MLVISAQSKAKHKLNIMAMIIELFVQLALPSLLTCR